MVCLRSSSGGLSCLSLGREAGRQGCDDGTDDELGSLGRRW